LRGPAGWQDAEGRHLDGFDDCLDIDLAGTPFTNTLPIRRMNWQVGQAEVLRMIYIRIPHLTPRVVQQRYTCLEQTDGGATFRYESLDSGFTANLPVDATGVVLDYPNIWERVYPKADRG
ncbi:MAG: putative glycolipid-binding domain-containing protein, partial [Anaerolineae bacterium]|nr:putative glycolipid-binding domain-containing protein [Anaerolineae bacterium]